MNYEPYLQGSYPNFTNIRGDSDVDLVVETDSVSFSNLTEDEKQKLGIGSGRFGWDDYRSEVLAALRSYYGSESVDGTGDKSLKVLVTPLPADVVPAIEYHPVQQGEISHPAV